MALGMSQMLRSSKDLRGTRPTAKKKNVSLAQKKVREEPVREELSAAVAPAVERTDLEIYQRLVKVTEEVFAAARTGTPPEESTIISILRAYMGKLREGKALLVKTMRQHQGVPDLAKRGPIRRFSRCVCNGASGGRQALSRGGALWLATRSRDVEGVPRSYPGKKVR